jgi:acetylornithine/succinyldiaminopimelate/putrescine aminotransferase
MAILDLTSGGSATYVLGSDHPELMAAAGAADSGAPARLREMLAQATQMNVVSLTATAEEARAQACALARRLTGRKSLVACRGATVEPGARLVAHGDALQTRAAFTKEQPAAFVLEVVQVSGGVRVPPPDYCDRVRADCTASGVMLLIDETHIGLGRTGGLLAADREKLEADLTALSLSLLPGVHGGAVLARRSLDVPAGDDGIDPRAAAIGLAALAVIARDDLVANAHKLSRVLQKGVVEILETRRRWGMDTRGRGLARALTLWENATPVVTMCRERGLAIGTHGDAALFFAPPITATAEDLGQTLAVLDGVLVELTS